MTTAQELPLRLAQLVLLEAKGVELYKIANDARTKADVAERETNKAQMEVDGLATVHEELFPMIITVEEKRYVCRYNNEYHRVSIEKIASEFP